MARWWTSMMGLFVVALVVANAGAATEDSALTATPASDLESVAPASHAAPKATLVYRSDFAEGAGNEWWPQWTGKTPTGDRPFLGEFGIEPVTFTCRDLPPHKFVQLTLSLFMLRTVDGSSAMWGPDPWELQVLGGPRLLYTTFDNCGSQPGSDTQAFPDNYPWAIHEGWTGAAEKQTLGYPFQWPTRAFPEDASGVYRLVLLFPHEDKDLRLRLQALWGELVKVDGESWGLESMEVETLDGPLPLADQQLEGLWQDLDGDGAEKAFSALWTMVGGGEKTVQFICDNLDQLMAKEQPVVEEPKLPSPEEELPDLLVKMDDEDFKTREQATQRLLQIGRPILLTLLQLIETIESPEVKVRLKWVVAELNREVALEVEAMQTAPKPPPPGLLAPRLVRVLETIGSPSALEVLDLGAQQKNSPISPYAAAARQRLAERFLDDWLARADASSRAGDLQTAEKWCDQAQAFARKCLPDDQGRVASVRADCRMRQKAWAETAIPADAAARREAMLYRLVVADDPAGAVQLADSPEVREQLQLATKPMAELSDAELLGLRTFYLKEAQDADGRIRTNLVARAMEAARPDSQPTEKPFIRSDGVDRDLLADWLVEQAERGRWTDFLPLVDVPMRKGRHNAVPLNEWWREGNGVKGGGSTPPLVLPVQPIGSYQIRLTFVPVELRMLCVVVPVGNSHVRVGVYDEGGNATIMLPRHPGVVASTQWSPAELVSAGEYRADVTVRQDADGTTLIRLDVDGRTLVEWCGKVPDAQGRASGSPIMGVVGQWALLRDVSLRMLDGKLKPVPTSQPVDAEADQQD